MGKVSELDKAIVKAYYDYNGHDYEGIDCEAADDGMCDQSQAKACDINELMKKYEETGLVPQAGEPLFGHYAYGNFQSDMEKVLAAQEAFDALPATTRKRFENSPAALINWLGDDNNYDEAVKLGLMDDKKVEARNKKKAPPVKEEPKT